MVKIEKYYASNFSVNRRWKLRWYHILPNLSFRYNINFFVATKKNSQSLGVTITISRKN